MSNTKNEKIEIMSSTKNEKIEIDMDKGLKTMDHEIRLNGHCLKETKAYVQPYIVPAHGKVTKLVVHSRFIDDRSYTVKKTFPLTGKSFSEALIRASVNPQYDESFFIELGTRRIQAQNMLCTKIVLLFLF